MTWPWITLIALGAWHGCNPGMGWLFAVSRGLQDRRGRSVLDALPPIALGHALAIGVALAVIAVGRASLPLGALRWATAGRTRCGSRAATPPRTPTATRDLALDHPDRARRVARL